MKHRIVWFTEIVEGVPVLVGQREEDSLNAWDLSEACRLEAGINLEAYVPVVDALSDLSAEDLPDPARALEVLSDACLASIRADIIKIKDRYGMPREIQGGDLVAWLEGYRELWRQGFYIARTPL